jgi:hypothetical protein
MDEECRNRKVPATDLDLGFLGVGWQLFGAVQRIEYIEHGLLQIGADVETQVDVAITGADVARHFDNTRNLPQGIFLWLDDAGFNLLGRCIAPRSIDVDLGILEIRQHLYWQRSDADQAQYEQQNGGSE